MKAVIVNNLSKSFSPDKKAVDDMSFTLEEGEVFGFLGPNGAGKTTTVKLLNGMLSASEGTCRVFDIDPAANPAQVHKLSGVITEHAQMYDNLTGIQNLVFYGSMFGISAFAGMTITIRADRYPEGIHFRKNENGYCEIDVQSEDEISTIVRRIVEGGGKVYHVSARKLSLEEIYFALTRRRKEEKEVKR